MLGKKGKSFVTIMLVIAISALLLRIIIQRWIAINIAQNESQASLTLKFISTAIENYAKDNKGVYPQGLSVLTESQPAYLDKDYINNSPLKGYIFSCSRLDAAGYSCYAAPVNCKLTGKMVYNVTTGGLVISEECQGKE